MRKARWIGGLLRCRSDRICVLFRLMTVAALALAGVKTVAALIA